jgi:uncharacterized protein YdaL
MASRKPVCWFKYNLWNLSTGSPYAMQFEAQFGFRFEFMDQSGFTNINYKTETLAKYPADPEIGRTTIVNSSRARAPASAWHGDPSNAIPYVVQGSNFWYVADVPFSYMSEEDRYLAFADLLHDIVQIPHPESRRAIIRLEDVDPTYPPELLRRAADYLASESVPFVVAVVPVYNDPLGYYNNGVAETIEMSHAPEFIQTLKYMVSKGAQLVMHGYTHQYDATPNPFTAVTGDDYEFFRVTYDAQTNLVDYMPVAEDSRSWVQNRLRAGLHEFRQSGLTAVAWETPHYAASALDYSIFAETFSLTIQRALYFDTAGHAAGQFFPYVIQQDSYGQKIMPENLGNTDPEWWYIYPPRFPADLIRAARKNRVVRDGWASAFFHPYLDLAYLQELVGGIKTLGYTYVPLTDNVPPTITTEPQSVTTNTGARVAFTTAAAGAPPLRYQWQFNGANISNATNTTFNITNAQPGHSGTYGVVVTNNFGSVTSFPATLRIVAPFAASSVSFKGGTVRFSFPTQSGVPYHIEYKPSLNDPEWLPLTTINGNGSIMQVTDSGPSGPARFYRIRAE